MNKIILLLIVVAVAGAAAFSGLFTPAGEKTNEPPTSVSIACVDEGAPITSDTVSYNSVTYFLIKSDAHVKGQWKLREMQPTGQVDTATGYPIYTMRKNFDGIQTSSDLIFVLQNSGAPAGEDYIFKIYLREGVPIPDEIINCKSKGGTMKVVVGNTASFPPDAFSKTEIIGLDQSVPDVAAAYIY